MDINEATTDELLGYTYEEDGVEYMMLTDCPGYDLDAHYETWKEGWIEDTTFLEYVREQGFIAVAAENMDFKLGSAGPSNPLT